MIKKSKPSCLFLQMNPCMSIKHVWIVVMAIPLLRVFPTAARLSSGHKAFWVLTSPLKKREPEPRIETS